MAFFVSSEYKSMKLMKLGCCLSMLVLQLLPVKQPKLSLQCPHLGRFFGLWIHLSKSWFGLFSVLMTNYTILCLCNDTACAGGWVMLPEKCSWFKNCLQALPPQSGRVYLCALFGLFVHRGSCIATSLWEWCCAGGSHLALCNSWSFLCSQDVFK